MFLFKQPPNILFKNAFKHSPNKAEKITKMSLKTEKKTLK
jgi:hypothetical protein